MGKIWQPFPIQTEPRPLDGVCLSLINHNFCINSLKFTFILFRCWTPALNVLQLMKSWKEFLIRLLFKSTQMIKRFAVFIESWSKKLMFQNWIILIQGILKYVSDNTGLNITDIITAKQVFDTLLIKKENNYPLPRWLNDSTYKSLKEISDMCSNFLSSTKLIQRLRTGEKLHKIWNQIKSWLLSKLY